MTDGHIADLFPNASADFLARNTGQTTKLECCDADALPAPAKTQGSNPTRVLIIVTSVCKNLLDEDNICEKFHVDCLRYAGLIPEDTPDHAQIKPAQRKARKGEAEHTQIEIFALDEH